MCSKVSLPAHFDFNSGTTMLVNGNLSVTPNNLSETAVAACSSSYCDLSAVEAILQLSKNMVLLRCGLTDLLIGESGISAAAGSIYRLCLAYRQNNAII